MARALVCSLSLTVAAAFVPALRSPWTQPARRPASCATPRMASTADFKNGLTIEIDGAPHKITEFLHVKPGKGSAFVRSKIKNLITGNSADKTFRAGEPIELADVYKSDFQFSYNDGENFVFMNMETYEELPVDAMTVGTASGYLSEGIDAQITTWNGKVIDVELPNTLDIKVVETDPVANDQRKNSGTKPAKLETGAIVKVPMFIETGELIKVDTREDRYISRASES